MARPMIIIWKASLFFPHRLGHAIFVQKFQKVLLHIGRIPLDKILLGQVLLYGIKKRKIFKRNLDFSIFERYEILLKK